MAPAVGTGGKDTVWYSSQDRKHRPGWHYLRMRSRLIFSLLVRTSLFCPARFPPQLEDGESAGGSGDTGGLSAK